MPAGQTESETTSGVEQSRTCFSDDQNFLNLGLQNFTDISAVYLCLMSIINRNIICLIEYYVYTQIEWFFCKISILVCKTL